MKATYRKNALFAPPRRLQASPAGQWDHDEGGKSWGRIASLIETAKIKRIDPFAYLRSTLERIARGHLKTG